METFLLRGTFTKEAFLTLLNGPLDYEIVFEKLLSECGVRMIAWFYSPSNSGWVSICEATPEQIAAVQLINGATERKINFTAELLLSGSDIAKCVKAASIVKL